VVRIGANVGRGGERDLYIEMVVMNVYSSVYEIVVMNVYSSVNYFYY